ncbi:LOG family protein [Anaeromyxobacter paludicola]|uniref:Cytokinin riboside 5'-monophosphate phosphoribohydrolase n=1 Tax=Anaeromyxobacter paludicola TaxID=2918171 RepID=A0ABN6N8A7_9BACT|nr:TIGR00730 family Rossman fold protein [Anaeromyxobacter paludicola]BDG08182.1 putative cytokinin riboside 5'-monophosphate phosphoribohydrolase [Anaeromyxobacter paludicola]
MSPKSICVFCGSAPGKRPAYVDAARNLGALLARRGITLVYGGSSVGLMGALADSALAAGGRVMGVIPNALEEKEIGHKGLTQLEVVPSMHARKARMAELAEAFVALPGGFGTLEEFAEILTWAQLGLHQKPFGLLDVEGYYRPLTSFFDHAVEEGFVGRAQRDRVAVAADPAALLDLLERAAPPLPGPAWIRPEQT